MTVSNTRTILRRVNRYEYSERL